MNEQRKVSMFLITPIKIFGCTTSLNLKPLQQVALTSTSNCIHDEEGQIYVIICINWYQMFAPINQEMWQFYTKHVRRESSTVTLQHCESLFSYCQTLFASHSVTAAPMLLKSSDLESEGKVMSMRTKKFLSHDL